MGGNMFELLGLTPPGPLTGGRDADREDRR
jgi:hypothetical protein